MHNGLSFCIMEMLKSDGKSISLLCVCQKTVHEQALELKMKLWELLPWVEKCNSFFFYGLEHWLHSTETQYLDDRHNFYLLISYLYLHYELVGR